MSMPRDPIFHTEEPSRNLIPAAGGAVHYPLHADSLLVAGISGLPDLVQLGTPAGSPYATAGVYTFPTNNTDAALQAEEHATNLYLDAHLSLYGSAVDSQIIVAMDVSFSAAPAGTATLWCWGRNLSASTIIGLDLTSSETPRFLHRSKGGTLANPTMTADSGTFAAFRNQGVFSLVMGLRLVTSTTLAVDMLLGNGALSAQYSLAEFDVLGAGTAIPGISDGITMADFGGLYLGTRGAAVPQNYWGNGAANVSALGNFSARKFDSYSAPRVTEVMDYMVNRKRDFPRNLCSDYS